MQRYLVATICLLLATLATAAYAWQAPEDTTARVAVLRYAKPTQQVSASEEDISLVSDTSPASVEITLSPVSNRITESTPNLVDPLLQPVTLPETYDQFEATVDLNEETNIGDISFSTDISADYKAIDPTRRFVEGDFTLYATFAYEEMENGMVWSWVWRRNGQVLEGGNQVWSYGIDGPGYVYLRPEEGFIPGDYTLEVWVNGEQLAQSNFSISEGISASN